MVEGKTPSEELLKKIEKLEEGQAVLKREMTKLLLARGVATPPRSPHQRSHSASPQRSRLASAAAACWAPGSSPSRRRSGGFDSAWGRGSSSFRQASSLQRESSTAGRMMRAEMEAIRGHRSLREMERTDHRRSRPRKLDKFNV